MIRFLFFDNYGYELAQGFQHQLEPGRRHAGNPLFAADRAWEHSNAEASGRVLKTADGPGSSAAR
ncbi:MAG: hypothetical protein QME94_02945 [Anaerolineae bacterium]|nr:hypothetical protein [Anaerolineae bacterium]